jgi:hypothetical protein
MSNIGEYFIELYKFTPNKLYKELNKLLDETLDFTIKQYIRETGTDKEEYKIKYTILVNEILQYIQKTEAVLELLIISDPSQTNKFSLEECLAYYIRSSSFNNLLVNLNHTIEECDLQQKTIKECSDLKKEEHVNEYVELTEKKLNLILLEKINIFNMFINDYIKSIIKIKTVLKKLSTSSSTDY